MKFTRLLSSGSGSNRTPFTHEESALINKGFLKTYKYLNAGVKFPLASEAEQNPQLDITWNYIVTYENAIIYKFWPYQHFILTGTVIPATIEQLAEVVTTTHKYLQDTFEEQRKGYLIFDAITDISPDTIGQTVHQIKEVLLAQLK